jgi:hypothetical protein
MCVLNSNAFNTVNFGDRIGPHLQAYFLENKMFLHNNYLLSDQPRAEVIIGV